MVVTADSSTTSRNACLVGSAHRMGPVNRDFDMQAVVAEQHRVRRRRIALVANEEAWVGEAGRAARHACRKGSALHAVLEDIAVV